MRCVQVEEVLRRATILPWRSLEYFATNAVSDGLLLSILEEKAVLVRGLWVIRSDLYPPFVAYAKSLNANRANRTARGKSGRGGGAGAAVSKQAPQQPTIVTLPNGGVVSVPPIPRCDEQRLCAARDWILGELMDHGFVAQGRAARATGLSHARLQRVLEDLCIRDAEAKVWVLKYTSERTTPLVVNAATAPANATTTIHDAQDLLHSATVVISGATGTQPAAIAAAPFQAPGEAFCEMYPAVARRYASYWTKRQQDIRLHFQMPRDELGLAPDGSRIEGQPGTAGPEDMGGAGWMGVGVGVTGPRDGLPVNAAAGEHGEQAPLSPNSRMQRLRSGSIELRMKSLNTTAGRRRSRGNSMADVLDKMGLPPGVAAAGLSTQDEEMTPGDAGADASAADVSEVAATGAVTAPSGEVGLQQLVAALQERLELQGVCTLPYLTRTIQQQAADGSLSEVFPLGGDTPGNEVERTVVDALAHVAHFVESRQAYVLRHISDPTVDSYRQIVIQLFEQKPSVRKADVQNAVRVRNYQTAGRWVCGICYRWVVVSLLKTSPNR